MASPSVVTTSSGGESTGVTSHTITLPSGVVDGDLLTASLKLAAVDGGVVWPAGWYVFANHTTTSIAFRDADGSEGASIEVLTNASSSSSFTCYRISGHEDTSTQMPEAVTPIPTNYRGLGTCEVYGNTLVAAERETEASSDDPGVFTFPNSHTWAAGTIAVHPSGAAFPVVEGRNLSRHASVVTSHTVKLPGSIVSGETLIVLFSRSGSTDDITFPGGWTVFGNFASGSDRLQYAWRKADGGEGATITVTTTGSVTSCHLSYRISGATDPTSTAPNASTGATGSSATPDPDSLSPAGGSAKFLWLAVAVVDGEGDEYPSAGASGNSTTPDPPSLSPTGGSKDYLFLPFVGYDADADASTAPASYSNLLTASTYEAGIGSAERQLTASSDDPGTFGWSGAADTWVAITVAIHPTAAAPGVLGGAYYQYYTRNIATAA